MKASLKLWQVPCQVWQAGQCNSKNQFLLASYYCKNQVFFLSNKNFEKGIHAWMSFCLDHCNYLHTGICQSSRSLSLFKALNGHSHCHITDQLPLFSTSTSLRSGDSGLLFLPQLTYYLKYSICPKKRKNRELPLLGLFTSCGIYES